MYKKGFFLLLIIVFYMLLAYNPHPFRNIITFEDKDYFNPNVGLELPNDSFTENGQLFLSELYIFKYINNTLTPDDISRFHLLMQNTIIKKGLYHRRKGEVGCREMSHDNLTGIISFSYLLGLDYHKDIWKYLKENNYSYNNCGKSFRLPYHPSQYLPWALKNNDWLISSITLPFYIVNMTYGILLTNYYSTSSKILYFVELYPLKEKRNPVGIFLFTLYDTLMKYRYKDKYLNEISKIYFYQNPNYPILKEIRAIKKL